MTRWKGGLEGGERKRERDLDSGELDVHGRGVRKGPDSRVVSSEYVLSEATQETAGGCLIIVIPCGTTSGRARGVGDEEETSR